MLVEVVTGDVETTDRLRRGPPADGRVRIDEAEIHCETDDPLPPIRMRGETSKTGASPRPATVNEKPLVVGPFVSTMELKTGTSVERAAESVPIITVDRAMEGFPLAQAFAPVTAATVTAAWVRKRLMRVAEDGVLHCKAESEVQPAEIPGQAVPPTTAPGEDHAPGTLPVPRAPKPIPSMVILIDPVLGMFPLGTATTKGAFKVIAIDSVPPPAWLLTLIKIPRLEPVPLAMRDRIAESEPQSANSAAVPPARVAEEEVVPDRPPRATRFAPATVINLPPVEGWFVVAMVLTEAVSTLNARDIVDRAGRTPAAAASARAASGMGPAVLVTLSSAAPPVEDLHRVEVADSQTTLSQLVNPVRSAEDASAMKNPSPITETLRAPVAGRFTLVTLDISEGL